MAYVIPTDLHAHMISDVARVRLVASFEVDPIASYEGYTTSRMSFRFACPEFPGDHRVVVPYDWDSGEWIVSMAKATRDLPPELYADVLSLIQKASPFAPPEKKSTDESS